MTAAGMAIEAACLTLGQFSLRNIDLTLDAGEILVLLGPNGADKSVCLEMIAGFHRPQAGRIMIHGRDVTDLPPEQRTQCSLRLNQSRSSPNTSIRRNPVRSIRRTAPNPVGRSPPPRQPPASPVQGDGVHQRSIAVAVARQRVAERLLPDFFRRC